MLDEFVAEDLVHHAGLFVDEIGRDVLKEDLAALLEAFPDIRFSADVIVASEDRAAAVPVTATDRRTGGTPAASGATPLGRPVHRK